MTASIPVAVDLHPRLTHQLRRKMDQGFYVKLLIDSTFIPSRWVSANRNYCA